MLVAKHVNLGINMLLFILKSKYPPLFISKNFSKNGAIHYS